MERVDEKKNEGGGRRRQHLEWSSRTGLGPNNSSTTRGLPPSGTLGDPKRVSLIFERRLKERLWAQRPLVVTTTNLSR